MSGCGNLWWALGRLKRADHERQDTVCDNGVRGRVAWASGVRSCGTSMRGTSVNWTNKFCFQTKILQQKFKVGNSRGKIKTPKQKNTGEYLQCCLEIYHTESKKWTSRRGRFWSPVPQLVDDWLAKTIQTSDLSHPPIPIKLRIQFRLRISFVDLAPIPLWENIFNLHGKFQHKSKQPSSILHLCLTKPLTLKKMHSNLSSNFFKIIFAPNTVCVYTFIVHTKAQILGKASSAFDLNPMTVAMNRFCTCLYNVFVSSV